MRVSNSSMAAPRKIDYQTIEPDWVAGLKSPAQIAAEYTERTGVSVSHVAITKHFKRAGIARSLKARIMEKAESMVTASMVSGKVDSETIRRDSEIVEGGALAVANIRIGQRSDIARAKSLTMKLLGELEAITDHADLFEQLTQCLKEATGSQQMALFMRVLDLPSRIKGSKELADNLRTLISLEREAWGIDSAPPPADDTPMDEMELARRVAFLLAQASTEAPRIH